MEMAKAGKVRILATTGESRTTILPNVPTLRESGINVTADAFVGLYAPAGLPANKVRRQSIALNEAMQSPDLQKRFQQFAMTPAYSPPGELSKYQVAGLARWEGPVKASGFSGETAASHPKKRTNNHFDPHLAVLGRICTIVAMRRRKCTQCCVHLRNKNARMDAITPPLSYCFAPCFSTLMTSSF